MPYCKGQKKNLKSLLHALFGEFSLSTCFQSTKEIIVLKKAIDLSFISRFVMCTGSLLESSIKSSEIRNIGKWSEISDVIIPEYMSVLRK